MASKSGEAKVKEFHKSKPLWLLLIAAALIIVFHFMGAISEIKSWFASSGSASDWTDKPAFKEITISHEFGELRIPEGWHVVRIQLSDRWSGCIHLPPDHKFKVVASHADIIFNNSIKPVEIRPGKWVDFGIHESNSSFRVRGKGEFLLYLEPVLN